MQTRAAYDSGRFRDKIPVEDPAASPLGTDSEASGFRQSEGSQDPLPAGGLAPVGTHPHGHQRGDSPDERRMPGQRRKRSPAGEGPGVTGPWERWEPWLYIAGAAIAAALLFGGLFLLG